MKSGWNLSKISAAFLAGVLLIFCSAILAFTAFGGINRIPTAHADTGTAASSPSSGPVGAIIDVMGSGWTSVPNGTIVSFGYSTNSNCSSAILPADSPGMINNGAFHGWFRWPQGTAEANYMVCAFMTNITAPANTYTVLSQSSPQISVSPSSAVAGQQATITGMNYLPANTSISLGLQSANGTNSVLLGSALSDINGNFSETFTVPGNMTGSDLIVANAGAGQPPTLSSSTPFTVKGPQPVASPTPNPGPTPRPTAPPVPTTTTAGAPIANPTTVAKTPTVTTHATMTPTATLTSTNGGTTGTGTPSSVGGTTGGTSTGTNGGGYTSKGTSSSHNNFSPIIGIGALIFLVIILLSAVLVGRRLLSASRMKNYPPSGMAHWTRGMKSVHPPGATNGGTSQMGGNGSIGNVPTVPVAGPAMQNSPLTWPAASVGVPPGAPSVSPMPPQSPLPLDPSLETMMRDAQQGLFAAPRQR